MVKLIGTAATIADVLVAVLQPESSASTLANVPGGRNVILSETAHMASSLYGCLEPHIDSLLAETTIMSNGAQ